MMTPELDKALCEEFPLIFRNNRTGEPTTTYGFACGDGWYDLIRRLCKHIQGHIDSREERIEWTKKWNADVNDPNIEWKAFSAREERVVPELIEQVVAVQVKEKFGGLRFYIVGGDDYIRGLIDFAEAMSYDICEVCGEKGHLRNDKPWIRTLCDKHAEERK